MFLESEKAARWSSGRLCAALWGGLQLTNAVQQLTILFHRTNQALHKQMLLHKSYLLKIKESFTNRSITADQRSRADGRTAP